MVIYLDYNATCPLESKVQESIISALSDFWANPSSSSEHGQKAKEKIEQSRKHVARLVGCDPLEIVFTSGGTEANNLVISSALEYFEEFKNRHIDDSNFLLKKPHVITSSIEHDSIKLPLKYYKEKKLIDLTVIPVHSGTGYVEIERIFSALQANTCLVTIMLANNETGVIQPVEQIAHKIRNFNLERQLKILLHTDAAQAIGKIPVDVSNLKVDFLTIVGHKFYGPRIGSLYAKAKIQADQSPNWDGQLNLHPNLFGGGQERGTENTPMIIGLGEAANLINTDLISYQQHMTEIRDYFESMLKAKFNDSQLSVNFQASKRLPNTSSVVFSCWPKSGADLLAQCQTFLASTGAACHDNSRASPVMLSCGLSPEAARRTVRFSVGRATSKQDIDLVISELFKICHSEILLEENSEKSRRRRSVQEDGAVVACGAENPANFTCL